MTTYLNYNKTFGEFTVDATAGYDYQAWKSSSEKYSELNVAGIEQKALQPAINDTYYYPITAV